MANFRRISKLLSLLLRHRPDEFGLAIDAYGYVALDEVLEAIQQRYAEVTEEDIRQLVEQADQRRFEINEKGIRALYGHSFFVEVDDEPIEPPELLYTGCPPRTAEKIRKEGIRPVDRFYVHLSLSPEIVEARNSKLDQLCVVAVEALKAHQAGHQFYQRGPVVLTTKIPVEFIGAIKGLADGGTAAGASDKEADAPAKSPAAEGAIQYGRKPRKALGRR